MRFTDLTLVPVPTHRLWQADDASADESFHAADALASYTPGSLPDLRALAGARDGETLVVSITEIFDGRRVIAGGFSVALDLG